MTTRGAGPGRAGGAGGKRRRLVGQPLLYAISTFASLGVFLFGYDQGVMSGIITGPHFIQFFKAPGPIEVGSMVAVLEVGAFATSLAAGRIGDIIGRKGTLFIGALVFTVGGAIQTFTTGFWMMVLGRIVSGCGVGLLSTIVPIYQSEISPPDHRGALACAEFTGNIFGYAFSVWTDYFCSYIDSDLAWRIPLFIQCVIGAFLAAGSLIMPESPRWLIDTDKDDEGLRILADLHGGDLDDPIAKAEYREIKDKVIMERESGEERTYAAMWRKYKQRVLLAMSSQAFAQLNGINVISYYAPKVFEEAGWLGRQAILMTGINAIIYLLSTLPPWYLVDRWGRRPILLSGAVVMAIALCFTGYFIHLDQPYTPNAVVACVIIFNAAFGYSWGPIPWLYPPEIMPLTVRAKGVSLSTATNWLFNTLVGEVTPYLQEVIQWRLYIMHGFFCLCSFVLVYFLYPETKGVPLEEMDAVFGESEWYCSCLRNICLIIIMLLNVQFIINVYSR
ncbi:general substrate transporter [Dendrothele bispora CBS 962.96]|uniref:General substrate transporter n=1 Tax=Dendrothele bispora (strain CBS 962.96) TaxID=1314807 RepID=A0A4S8LBF8_DENBC|nr:general substrate transporter [Dendrothele bispora CBS 962.96]